MSWLASHAISPALAAAVGVSGTPGGTITFIYGHTFERYRKPDGSMRQEQGKGTWLYWPCGGQRAALTVLLTEGEGDTLAAASVLCDDAAQPRENLPAPLAGVVPVGLPGCTTPLRVVCGELLAANTRQVFVCLDADESGQRATQRICAALDRLNIEAIPVELPEGKDLADCLVGEDHREGFLAHLLADAEAATHRVAV